MRRRHKIRSVMVSKHGKGFGLMTNGGSVWFPSKSKRVYTMLGYHLPHIREELLELKPNSSVELEELLIGRYVYGRSMEAMRGETVTKVLI